VLFFSQKNNFLILKKNEDKKISCIRVRKCLLRIGTIYQSSGDNKSALEYFMQLDQFKSATNDVDLIDEFYTKRSISQIFLELDNFSKSKEYALSALELAKGMDTFELINAYLQVGKILAFEDSFYNSQKYYDSALIGSKQNEMHHEFLYELFFYSGQNFQNLNNYGKALDCFRKSLQYSNFLIQKLQNFYVTH
jgi:tetratricopeptide (TPR) repeat protein